MNKILFAFAMLAAVPCAAQTAPSGPDRYTTYRVVLDPSGESHLEAGVALFTGLDGLAYRGLIEGSDAAGVTSRWYLRPLVPAFLLAVMPKPGSYLHDYYGHGSYLREYGLEAGTDYEWGWGFNSESNAASPMAQASPCYEARQAWIGGGLAATQLYLLEREKEIYRTDRFSLEAVIPLLTAYNDLGYIGDGLDPSVTDQGRTGDGASWVYEIKLREGYAVASSFSDRAKSAIDKTASYDPAVYWALLVAAHYLWTGDDALRAPALPIAGLKLGFSPKVNLTPVAAENYYYFFVSRNKKLLSLYIREGHGLYGRISGWGAEFNALSLGPVDLAPGVDYWKLPGGASDALPHNKSGSGWHLRADVRVYKSLGVTAKWSEKSAGYLLGQPNRAGGWGYAGLSLSF